MKKSVFLVGVILIVVVGSTAFFFGKKSSDTIQSTVPAGQDSGKKDEVVVPNGNDTSNDSVKAVEERAKTGFPSEIEGKVVGMTNTKWIVEQSTGALEVGIDIETPVYKNEVSEANKAEVFDVKAGTVIKAKLDAGSGDVIEAVIISQ